MSPGSMDIFDPNNDPYRAEVEERWGKDAYAKSAAIVRSWGPEKLARIKAEGIEISKALAGAADQAPDSAAVQAAVERHFRHITQFYDQSWPLLKIYRGLGDLYVSDPRFAANYAKFHPDLPAFLRQAMILFCDRQEGK